MKNDSKFQFKGSIPNLFFSFLSPSGKLKIYTTLTHTRSVFRSSPISPLVGLFKEEDNIFCLHGGTQEEEQ
jgi:hypothetical protein